MTFSQSQNNYCVILAGGKGKRLWPCSREAYPKQFMDFFGTGRTQLQQTYDRFVKFIPATHIYINTNIDYADIVRQQLPELPEDNLLVEPIFRNTAPSIAWALHRILQINADANIVVTPSDQAIVNEEAFQGDILGGLDFVSQRDCILTMGVQPTRPEPGYGYIQLGEPAEHGVFKVQSFTEKPEREFAKMFMESGEFYWNTGLFLAHGAYFNTCLFEQLPQVFKTFDEQIPTHSFSDETTFAVEHFSLFPNLSLEHATLEHSDNVYMMRCNFGWADLGTWHSIYEAMQKSDDDNVLVDSEAILEDCHNNVIRLPKDKIAVIQGLDGYIVAEQDNVLLICRKEDSSALVRKFGNEVRMKYGNDYV